MFKSNVYLDTDKIYYNELPSSIKTQLKVLKEIDMYTRKHIEDVPKQVYKICRQMNLNEEATKFIMIASYLHDVGKIFISPDILQKPGKLTDEEYDIMKSHAAKGYDVCMSFDELHQYAKIVRGHHENLDGTGYPDRLSGKQISTETRIIKVADVYSALLNKRQYKEEFSTKQIFEIMYNDVSNGKTDGEIVYYLLLAIINEKTEVLNTIKRNLHGYKKQLEYSENILNCLEKYINQKMGNDDILTKISMNRNINKLKDFDISNISDANKLLIYMNNNIIILTKNIQNYKIVTQELKELKDYAKKMMNKF